jgi:aryl-alcohol dehydrogenase-like predicted oxidoreductase
MKYRLFGRNSGLRVSECCLGGGNFGTASPAGIEPSVAREIMAAFADAGGNFIDTSSGYQAGQSEEIVGKFVKPRRDAFVVGTKYSIGVDRSEHYAVRGNSRKAMMASIDGSLTRLQTDHVDIFWLHGHDAVTPMEEILRGMDDLVSAGKVLYVGFSNFPAWRLSRGALLAELRGYAPLTGIQIEYSATERDADRELIPMAEALGLGVTLWSVLGGAFLSGQAQSGLPHWTQLGRPNAHDWLVYKAVKEVADSIGAHPAQVGFAWVLHRFAKSPTACIPIIGARTGDEIRQVLGVQALAISDEQFEVISKASAPNLGEPHNHNELSMDFVGGGPYYRPLYGAT